MRKLLLALSIALALAPLARAQKPTATATSHSVTLTWTGSTSPGVTSYNVYRASTSGGPYGQIASVTAPATTYTDTNVSAGETYYYVVTAVASSSESGYSNEASAIVPSGSSAPNSGDIWYWSGTSWIFHTPSTPLVVAAGTLQIKPGERSAKHSFSQPLPTGSICQALPASTGYRSPATGRVLSDFSTTWTSSEITIQLNHPAKAATSFSFICAAPLN